MTARPWGLLPGPASVFLLARAVGAWVPVTNPTGHALARWLCALWGQQNGAQQAGGTPCLREG